MEVKENRQEPIDLEASFPGETAHLQDIEKRVWAELEDAQDRVDRMEEEQRELQMYMAEHRGEGDAKEMFQTERIMQDVNASGTSAVLYLNRLKKVQDSPYFARIDFRPEEGEEASYYVGLYAFRHEKKLFIIDWRSPVASMFYDFETGPASYTAPEGTFSGELTLKRQFKIKNGQMEFAFDSSQNIQDDILQQELAHTSDEKMKSIISTIQKEQNRIIRDEKADVMIIQGVAGSGKTSIALHRVAFLLYRFRDTIKAQNVTIISPNKVFGDYIAGVLPELGEEPIFEASLEDLALIQIEEGVDFIGDRNPLEYDDPAWTRRVRFKGTADFVRQMDEFVEKLPELAFRPQDFIFGDFSVPADWIKDRVNIYRRFPLMKRLEQVADDIYSRSE
ncbi:MAG: helicase, partial [Acutalibacter sp.]|nr:helicase [Acutalibacter sp.]